MSLDSKSENSLFLVYRELEKLASAKESIRIPVLVQTRAQRGKLPLVKASGKRKWNPSLERKGKVDDAITAKQRKSPLSSWTGKQLLGQKIPKRYLDGVCNLQMMQGYPHGLLAIPSDGYSGQRIVAPVEKALIKSTHAEIHHRGHTKVHHVLCPLYYWPGIDATVCTACARCIRANERRKKLNLDFNQSCFPEGIASTSATIRDRLLRCAKR
jgi:hypothetical protein